MRKLNKTQIKKQDIHCPVFDLFCKTDCYSKKCNEFNHCIFYLYLFIFAFV